MRALNAFYEINRAKASNKKPECRPDSKIDYPRSTKSIGSSSVRLSMRNET